MSLPLFVASKEDAACCYEEEHEGDDPYAETDDRSFVRFWAGMFGYRSLDHSAGGRRSVDGDSGLDRGRE